MCVWAQSKCNQCEERDEDEKVASGSKGRPRPAPFILAHFFFYSHMHPFYPFQAVHGDRAACPWQSASEREPGSPRRGSSGWRPVMWQGQEGVDEAARELRTTQMCHPRHPPAVRGHNTSGGTSRPAQAPNASPTLQRLLIGRPPRRRLRERSRRNPINVMPDNPHLRPVVVTQHRGLILNSCLSLRSRAVQPRGAVALHYAWFNKIRRHRPLNAWFQHVSAMKTCGVGGGQRSPLWLFASRCLRASDFRSV